MNDKRAAILSPRGKVLENGITLESKLKLLSIKKVNPTSNLYGSTMTEMEKNLQ